VPQGAGRRVVRGCRGGQQWLRRHQYQRGGQGAFARVGGSGGGGQLLSGSGRLLGYGGWGRVAAACSCGASGMVPPPVTEATSAGSEPAGVSAAHGGKVVKQGKGSSFLETREPGFLEAAELY
jgi:hypothetical protein